MEFDYIGINYVNEKDFSVNMPLGIPRYTLLLFLTDIVIDLNNNKKQYPAGTILLYSPFTPQAYHNPSTGFSNDWLQLGGSELPALLEEIEFPINTPFTIQNPAVLHEKMKRLEEEFFSGNLHRYKMMDALLCEILLLLKREQSANAPSPELENRFREVRSYILSCPERPWTLDDMAALLGLSPSRFSHIYTTFFHISPKKNLLLERMNKAKFLIQTGNYSISEVAAMVGYNNLYHFSKQFKKITGKTPSDFRITSRD